MTRQALKTNAKAQLQGSVFSQNWLLATLVVFLVTAITSMTSSMELFGFISTLLIAGPLGVGTASLFLKQARDLAPMSVGSLFKGFTDDFKGNFALGAMILLYTFLWSLLFLIPGIVKNYAYSMAFYIKSDHPEYTFRQCLQESEALMQGNKLRLFILDLSFIGWFIIGSFCLGIGTLWVSAYRQATFAQFYQDLCGSIVVEATPPL